MPARITICARRSWRSARRRGCSSATLPTCEAPAVRRGIAHRLNGEIVSCRISKQFDADTVKVAAGVRQAFAELQKSLPKGVQLRIVYDQSQLVQSALSGVARAVLLGAFVVVLVLFALLGDMRAAMVVTFTIPLSLGLAGILLREANVGLNTMTLGGLAIAVGLLVDAAIIVTENVVHRLTQHRTADRMKTALAACRSGTADRVRNAHRRRGVHSAVRDDGH